MREMRNKSKTLITNYFYWWIILNVNITEVGCAVVNWIKGAYRLAFSHVGF
jgi:hypothetical protein